MKIRFLGSDSQVGGCPALYELETGDIVVQGQRLTDTEALAGVRDVLDGETFVVVPRDSLNHHWAPKK
ncbi:hypothetical protein [Actinopolymorpha sp. B9G3]|uniref:hypothetical protein n=1 Tax=Actinopolymorpha sp. B9G3 TaxID=3158970 RepID=UPI0032D96E87